MFYIVVFSCFTFSLMVIIAIMTLYEVVTFEHLTCYILAQQNAFLEEIKNIVI
jgi:hypothetical protein